MFIGKEVSYMGDQSIMGDQLAKYFVYYAGEGEHYVELIKQLRRVKTRKAFWYAVQRLLAYCDHQADQQEVCIHPHTIRTILTFIRTGDITAVSQFYATVCQAIWRYEMEKIKQQEQYLLHLLEKYGVLGGN
jgi:hypothetical protein